MLHNCEQRMSSHGPIVFAIPANLAILDRVAGSQGSVEMTSVVGCIRWWQISTAELRERFRALVLAGSDAMLRDALVTSFLDHHALCPTIVGLD